MILTPTTTVKLNKNSCTDEVQDSVSGYIQKIKWDLINNPNIKHLIKN